MAASPVREALRVSAAIPCYAVDAEILGEYWLSYIVADWSEYGAGKNNLRYGLVPPISGWYRNHNKDSCGCFIRSEIWVLAQKTGLYLVTVFLER